MNEYRFLFDDAYLIESMQRYRQASGGRIWRGAVKSVCFLGLLGILVFTVVSAFETPGVLLVGLIPLTFLVLLAMGPRFDYWVARRRFKASPSYGAEMSVSLAEAGVSFATKVGHSELNWVAFARAVAFPDGFLLFTSPRFAYWLANRALARGALGDVSRLFQSHVRLERKDVA